MCMSLRWDESVFLLEPLLPIIYLSFDKYFGKSMETNVRVKKAKWL